ncbi:MAG: hypothetical protein KAJ51_04405 [Thermoplasmata archaeon]|nr:hypothetical protein [Thermoplasmata archaeon]
MVDQKKKIIVALLLCVFILILSYLSLSSPWFNTKQEIGSFEYEYSSKVEFELQEYQVEMEGAGGLVDYEDTRKYEDIEDEDDSLDNTIGLFNAIYYIIIAIMILTILAMVLTVLAYFRKGVFKVLVGIILIALLLAILTPVFFAAALPTAFNDDFEEVISSFDEEGMDPNYEVNKPGYTESFAGEQKESGYEASWGPSSGWMLAIITFILIGIVAIVTIMPFKQPAEDETPEFETFTMPFDEGIRDAIVMDEPEVTYDKTNVFECPNCGKKFKVSTPDRPVTIRCPHCKVEGTIS